MGNNPILLIVAVAALAFFLQGGGEPKEPVTSWITVHEWMIDSISRDGKLTYCFNPKRYDREKAKIYGYSFHSDGGVNRIETHIGASTQTPVGQHLFADDLLTLEINGRETQVYHYKRTQRQLILSNDERTIWMSRYQDRYMSGWSHNLFIPDSLQEN